MTELLDNDGYPTTAALRKLKTFRGTYRELFELVAELTGEFGSLRIESRAKIEVRFATGGWSGNEDVLQILSQMPMLLVCIHEEHRGGLTLWQIPDTWWDNPTDFSTLTAHQHVRGLDGSHRGQTLDFLDPDTFNVVRSLRVRTVSHLEDGTTHVNGRPAPASLWDEAADL